MMDIVEIKEHAHKTADAGEGSDKCPYSDNSPQGRLWLDFYWARCMWLSGEMSA